MGQKYAAFDAQGNITAFYDSVDSPAPDGVANVVEISAAQWAKMLDAQSRGMRIVINEHREPAALDPLPPTRAQSTEMKRAQRDTALKATDWLVSRHQDEKLIGSGTTLTSAQFSALIKYRQALRDISAADGWPYIDLPAAPDFMTAIA
ncbi:phage tail assembly chaperone [Burkholderia ubonensis]|uniref:Phage tail protein n=1 Tax=Burkholderia ubonensis TaxID=101571 RepID=A0AB74D2R0_9BURK|nr:phage tail assembly chaperone [Burkholderia ubonensis]PAJ77731.1 phage tail protein [Burkholderia ubonensis]PAJ87617.1 phage tail protein [Burkholderia ubonensis]PAJ90395.1 phage tail protein [Burkholderia ubonensis]PAJ98168.1 phage tail protein [Burkholderia ubonensis]PAK08001.1 phage tail protein [Burkholderia ubonensis]